MAVAVEVEVEVEVGVEKRSGMKHLQHNRTPNRYHVDRISRKLQTHASPPPPNLPHPALPTPSSNNPTHNPRKQQQIPHPIIIPPNPIQKQDDSPTLQRCPPQDPPVGKLAHFRIPVREQEEGGGVFSLEEALVGW